MKNFVSGTLLLLLAGCAAPQPEVDPDYQAQISEWRARRVENLQAEGGWLTVVGLHWLRQGVNRFGSDPSAEIVLDAPGIPPVAGTLELGEQGVVARAASESGALINGEPFIETTVSSDAQGRPDVFSLGRLSFYLIERSGKLAARVKDPESEARRGFEGISYFEIDERYRVIAVLEAYEEIRQVEIPTITGDPAVMLAPGLLRFELDGRQLALEPYVDAPGDDSYFLVFRDRTSGDTSYGGGRFLVAEAVDQDGTTTIDFNYAYSPPCAFTAFATCPLPTPQNSLPIPIEAGEKFAQEGH
jgi:uncharacterized protein (DUF1684 family)